MTYRLSSAWIVRTLATAFAVAGLAGAAAAQGVLVANHPDRHWRLPRPTPEPEPASYRIASLEINALLRDAVAEVRVSQTFENTGAGTIEGRFVFPLPHDGAIDELTLLVDGKEFPARLLDAREARRQYEEIVRKTRDPALLEWVGTGMYQTSVFPIPPGARRTVTLRYTQVCPRSQGLTDFQFPLATAKYTSGELDSLAIRVVVESAEEIKTVYSPTHAISVERSDARHAVASLELKDTIPAADFRLFAKAEAGGVAASLISYRPDDDDAGYFLILASPQIRQPEAERTPKTVVFVIDRSGSMSGKMMEQAREALKFVLNNLHEGDTFNIVAYDSEVEAFRPELEKYSEKSRVAATGFVNGLFAGGTTNIDGALATALGMLRDDERPAYVIFLTDGLPTFGETSEAKIVANAAAANKVRARLLVFGVGYDLNSRLLDKLARSGHGVTEYVRPEENVEHSVSNLYRRIGAPVMTDATLAVEVEGAAAADGDPVNRLYPDGPFDLFAGDQAVFVGRYRTSGAAKVTLRGAVAGKQQQLAFPADLSAASDDDANAFVARLWATRRVGEIIDELDLHGKNDELIKELVDLATRHGILTPYTSFLADDAANVRDLSSTVAGAADRLSALEEVHGDFGFRQREAKAVLRSASGPAPASGGVGGGFGGRPLDRAARVELARRGGRGVTYYDAQADEERVADNVITVGRKTFFRRGETWIDSTVTADDETAAERIERYSDEYFELVTRHGRHVAAYLAIEDPVIVKLDGRVYAW